MDIFGKKKRGVMDRACGLGYHAANIF